MSGAAQPREPARRGRLAMTQWDGAAAIRASAAKRVHFRSADRASSGATTSRQKVARRSAGVSSRARPSSVAARAS